MNELTFLEQIQHIARNGLNYANNPYDRERYEHLLTLSTQMYQPFTGQPAEILQQTFMEELGHITPKIGTDAAIFNEEGQILLMERVDGTGWCLPCGWLEPNEKPAEGIVREVKEETGLDVIPQRLVGVFTRLPEMGYGPHTMVAIVHLCQITGGELTLSHEGLGLRYWEIESVPKWHANHKDYAEISRLCLQQGDVFQAISN